MLLKILPWIILPGVVIVLPLALWYTFDACVFGARVAARHTARFALILVLAWAFSFILFGSTPAPWRHGVKTVLLLVSSACFWAFALAHLISKPNAGRVLLDLGRSKIHVAMLIVATILLIAVGIRIFEVLNSGLLQSGAADIILREISQAFCFLSVGVFVLAMGVKRFQITEKGILFFARLIRWQRIKSYKWEGRAGLILTLKISKHWPIFNQCSLPIPHWYKDSVEELLAQNISESTSSRPKSSNCQI